MVGSGHSFVDYAGSFSRQRFQIARGQIFFAELNVVDSGAGSLGDLFQETEAASGFVCGERGAVGDVVEKNFGHLS